MEKNREAVQAAFGQKQYVFSAVAETAVVAAHVCGLGEARVLGLQKRDLTAEKLSQHPPATAASAGLAVAVVTSAVPEEPRPSALRYSLAFEEREELWAPGAADRNPRRHYPD